MSDTRLTELTEAKVAKRAERDSHLRGSDEYRRLNIEWGQLVEDCAEAQTEIAALRRGHDKFASRIRIST